MVQSCLLLCNVFVFVCVLSFFFFHTALYTLQKHQYSMRSCYTRWMYTSCIVYILSSLHHLKCVCVNGSKQHGWQVWHRCWTTCTSLSMFRCSEANSFLLEILSALSGKSETMESFWEKLALKCCETSKLILSCHSRGSFCEVALHNNGVNFRNFSHVRHFGVNWKPEIESSHF